MKRTLLYLSMIAGSPSHERKLAGIRRYGSMRGWEAVPIPREEVSPESLPDLLRRHQPVGCVADGVACSHFLRPSLFRGIPVSFIAYPWDIAGRFPNFHFDSALIAAAAFRELASGHPPCFAAVGHPLSWNWSRLRVRWFREAAIASGARCLAFPGRPTSARETDEAFSARLVPWLAKLPDHCAVFAACDAVAVLVTRAAASAGRSKTCSAPVSTWGCGNGDGGIPADFFGVKPQLLPWKRAMVHAVPQSLAGRGTSRGAATGQFGETP